MCFSAIGSFAISGVLSVVGAVSLARATSTPHRMLAGVPLIFALQQAAEGTVWLTLDDSHALLNRAVVSIFLGVAFVVWPVWLPVALTLVERSSSRRRLLRAAVWSGCFVALCAAVLIARLHPIPRVVGHSIGYQFSGSDHAPTLLLYLAAYVVPSVIPFFVSTFSRARWMGTMLVVSLAASTIVQRGALTSVWCFFAALLSGFMLFAVDRDQRTFGALHNPAV
jgi:hypothetical protein